MLNEKSLESGRIQHGRFKHVAIREPITSDLVLDVTHTQQYHNRFYLYGISNMMCTNSVYASNIIPGMYAGGANRDVNVRGTGVIEQIIQSELDLLRRLASFMNMEDGVPFDTDNRHDGLDTLRGISWKELKSGVELLNNLTLKLHYLSSTNKYKITRDNKHYAWKIINEYRNHCKEFLSTTQLQLYHKFRKWMKAEQFNGTYINEEGIHDQICELYQDLQNWCNSTNQYMFDMTTHQFNMMLYNETSASNYGDETFACTKVVNDVVEDGAAMVIQNAMRRYIKRKCLGVHRGRCNVGWFSNIYTELNFGRVQDEMMVQDPDTTIFAPMATPISPVVLNAVINTSSFWFTWSDWCENSFLGTQEQNNTFSVNEVAERFSDEWYPIEYTIPCLRIRDASEDEDNDDDDDDIEYDVLGDVLDDSTDLHVYDITLEINDDTAPAA